MSTTAPSNISLVFLDIDGTLIDSAFKIQEEVRTTIETCSKQGVKFALASGRPLFGAADVLKQLPISAPSVFFSGGLVYDPIRKQTLHQSTLEPEIVRALIDTAHSADIYIELYTVDNYFIEATTDLTALHARYLNRHPECTDLRRLATQDQILKVVMIANGHSEQDKLRELLSSNQHVSCGYASGAGDPDILFANLSSRDANRAATFELVL
ncbi:MAG: HAD hydrolase family protein, partial [Bdellovibrionales bacterium]|nr:HAD hydrolase family protein [Bdellovibrionales bacterium]